MSRFVDRFLNALKWPVALVAVLLLPAIGVVGWRLLARVVAEPGPMLPFFAGLGLFAALWWLLLRRRGWGGFVETFEHELVHVVFALLTFHPVVGFKVTQRDGGEMRYRGEGNWLITISPYFFPTLCVATGIVLAFVPARSLPWWNGLLGAGFGFHLVSIFREAHREQPDLRRAGWLFTLLFLPAANLVSLGSVLAFARDGLGGLGGFLAAIGREAASHLTQLTSGL